MSEPVEGPPLVTCPHCGSVVPVGDFCGHCGAHLAAGSKRRTDSFAASPTEHVAHLSIVTTLFPHLPHRRGAPFRIGLIVGGAVVLFLAALHLFAPATAAAVLVLPVLYLIYLYEVEVYEEEPWTVLGATMVAGALLGFVSAYAFGGSLADRLMTGDRGGAFLLAVIVIPIVDQALMLAGPMLLYRFRPQFREPLDGLIFGAASALGLTLSRTLTQLWPLLTQPLVGNGSEIDWAIRLTRAGLLVMLINACTTATIASAIWSRRFDRRRTGRPWYSRVPAALAVGFGVQLLLALLAFVVQDQVLDFGILVVAALVLLLFVRLVIHDALLIEGAEHEIGPDSICPECHRIVPAMAFCPACGAARSAAPKVRSKLAGTV
ncbi:MAG TPA: PrsW family glutamic-type intramembrane protease [Candidatus Dormibacteraeota bacterium]|nr:PrsW family glutamic-type intramembrane protease [Candidatus Dormibacteraeota bacterium]